MVSLVTIHMAWPKKVSSGRFRLTRMIRSISNSHYLQSITNRAFHGIKRRDLIEIVSLLLFSKVVVFASALDAVKSGNFLYIMSIRWDSNFFQQIAQYGYPSNTNSGTYAFSPLFPSLIALLHYVTGSYWVAALVLTNVLSFIFVLLMLRFFGFEAAVLASMFPTFVLFTTVPYADILTMIFLLLSFVLLLRKMHLFSGALFGLAIFNSYNLVYTIPAFILYILLQRKSQASVSKKLANLAVFLVPLIITGIGILAFYAVSTGNMFTYLKLESEYWGAEFVSPLTQAAWILNTNGQGWFTNQGWTVLGVRLYPAYWLIRNTLFQLFYIIGAVLLIKTKVSLNSPQNEPSASPSVGRGSDANLLFCIFSFLVIVPLFFIDGTPSVSIPRLLLPAFPIFLAYSDRISRKKLLDVYVFASLVITIWVTLSFMEAFFA
ncbi:MAG: hypothetical protein PXY39_00265 [archaeon]|nr:hypothetical protein [archaeon]